MNPYRTEEDAYPFKVDPTGFSGHNTHMPPKVAKTVSDMNPPVVVGKTPYPMPPKTQQRARMEAARGVNERAKKQLSLYGFFDTHDSTAVQHLGLVAILSVIALIFITRR